MIRINNHAGVNLSGGDPEPSGNLRRKIEVSDGEKDKVGETLEVEKPAGPVLDDFDDSIDSFANSIGQAGVDMSQDILEVATERAGELLERFQATSHDPGNPLVEESSGPANGPVSPEGLILVLEQPGPVDAVVRSLEPAERPGIGAAAG